MAELYVAKFPSNECRWTILMMSEHWFRQWLGAVRPQTIAWANVAPDLCHHMAWLGHNELKSRFRRDCHKRWICLYIPDKYVLRKCVFQKEFLIYAICRELIQRRCMKFIQTWQRVFPVFLCFFSNDFRFTSYKYVTFGYPKVHRPTYLIVISTDDLVPNWPQIRIWYGILTWINQLTAIDLNMFARIYRQQCILFIFVIFRFFFSEITRLCYLRHILFCT